MPSPETLAVFAGAVVLFAVLPGPAVIYVVTRSVGQGRLAGVVSAAGVGTGNLIHVAAATLGLSALLVSSAIAFTAVKYLGAAYLVYLGVRALVDRGGADQPEAVERQALGRGYRNGIVVAVLNPKTALFFLAFLPQFVDPSAGSTVTQVAILGFLLVAITAASDTCWALLSGTVGGWLRGSVRRTRRRRLLTGGMYISLGVSAGLAGEQPAHR